MEVDGGSAWISVNLGNVTLRLQCGGVKINYTSALGVE